MAPPMDVESPASVERRSACLSASLKLKNIAESGYASPVATPAHNPPFPSHKSSAVLMLIAVTLSSFACPVGLQHDIYTVSRTLSRSTLTCNALNAALLPPKAPRESCDTKNRKLGLTAYSGTQWQSDGRA